MKIPEGSHLHSTMYLLNPDENITISEIGLLFTFHYVSIKSLGKVYTPPVEMYLHSTMYLLNPRQRGA